MSFIWPQPMPKWLDHAFRHRGLREIPGPRHNPIIMKWIRSLKGWFTDDETPWCGTFVAHCLEVAGYSYPKHWYRAKAYSTYGTAVPKQGPLPYGAICVKSRRGGGHVFFAVAQSPNGQTIYGLGGNQSNMVNIVPFKLSELDDIRWPPGGEKSIRLPVVHSSDIQAANRGSEA